MPPRTPARRGSPTRSPAEDEAFRSLLSTLDVLPQPAWVIGRDGAPEYFNGAWFAYIGIDAGELDATGDWRRAVHAEDAREIARAWKQCYGKGGVFESELRLRHHSGNYRWVVARAHPRYDENGGIVRWYGVCTDIHERVMAQRDLANSAKLRNDMLDASVDCIKIIDPQGLLVHMNKSGCLALGVPVDEKSFGMKWLDLLPPPIRGRGQRALNAARKGKNARFAGMSIVGNNRPQYWDNILTPMKDAQGNTTAILCVSRDVTVQREAEKRLRIASEVDDLTDLPNRRCFKARLKRMIGKAHHTGARIGLILIDLDHFKNINDTLGHPAGDHLLRVLAKRFRNCLPKGAVAARLGGDEFAIAIDDVEGEQQVVAIAEQVLRQIVAPVSHTGRQINGGMSIGCAVFPRDARDASELMACADTALNDLKAGGRGGIRMFCRRMLEAAKRAATQLGRARQIVHDDAIEPHYQPKVRLADGAIVGLEALLRWRDPAGQIHPSGTVAEAFKDYELATGMGNVMHLKVLADMAAWRDRGLRLFPVSLNAAPVEFLRDDFADRLLRRLNEFRIPPNLIEIEVTEHILLERGAELVASALKTLKAAGVRIALDDFGTGHSSFAHLRDYPVNGLKIDCSFIERMVDEQPILSIVGGIAKLGPALSMDVVAEGIETQRQRDILLDLGCRMGQGFLFGAAISASEIAEKLGEGVPRIGVGVARSESVRGGEAAHRRRARS